MQIWAHGSTVLVVGSQAPRAPLNKSIIDGKISQYWRVSVVDLTASTQNDLADLVNSSVAKSGELIAAEFQSAGRGRLDRTFEAPRQSALLFSFYLQPKRSRSDWSFVSFLAAIAMQEVISETSSATITLKWPNDILIGDKKVAGLLAQQIGDGVIVGIGLNVSMSESELPVPTATSLALVGSNYLDRNLLLIDFLNRFESIYSEWESGANFLDKYRQISSTIGCQVRVEVLGRDPIEGEAVAISAQGALILRDGFEVNVGDVVHLR
ncbi:MAG: biotin--[acetyl-CoA-carboxylase] ligase [Actinobacteria bacterium]|jgi:BirA family biotin operon repressor/biotin-[acetyl-CoA-carboxylase] ligase|nr:biotin--[acetyl-CoA-carboxylase] ligase [Actinomycetota bacterium]MTA49163.1 biotin--[acetyl-CoA-carboxylase] ligase [Actinomycetota bacterium]MTA91150.1 biotin--[acetyl-CoA-carboxylase] ligase [Actinomycetota bacterium]